MKVVNITVFHIFFWVGGMASLYAGHVVYMAGISICWSSCLHAGITTCWPCCLMLASLHAGHAVSCWHQYMLASLHAGPAVSCWHHYMLASLHAGHAVSRCHHYMLASLHAGHAVYMLAMLYTCWHYYMLASLHVGMLSAYWLFVTDWTMRKTAYHTQVELLSIDVFIPTKHYQNEIGILFCVLNS